MRERERDRSMRESERETERERESENQREREREREEAQYGERNKINGPPDEKLIAVALENVRLSMLCVGWISTNQSDTAECTDQTVDLSKSSMITIDPPAEQVLQRS